MQRLSSSRGSHSRSIVLPSPLGFALWWAVLLAFHGFNLVYYVGGAVLYRQIRHNNLGFQLNTYSIGISYHEYGTLSAVHLAVAAAHAVCIVMMVIGSVVARRLVFQPQVQMAWVQRLLCKLLTRRVNADDSADTPAHGQRKTLPEISNSTGTAVFGRHGLLGVDSVYFDHLHLARELLETTLQTIQAYRMSYLLPRVGLVRFYVVLLVANCWATPFLYRYYHGRDVDRRMMSLLCDAVLDMMASIGVSFWILLTYVPQYADPQFGFPLKNWFNDVWFTNTQQEFQMMLVVSWADMASRLVFAIGVLQCVDAMKDLLSPARATTDIADVVPTLSGSERRVQPVGHLLFPPHPSPDNNASQQQCRVPGRPPRGVRFILEVVGPGFFGLWGALILCLHGAAEFKYHTSSGVLCELRLQPWLVSKPACSLVDINCHVLGHRSGSLDSLGDAWDTFEPGVTARLVIRHCPQLEIPSTIKRFTSLSGLKMYNSTIASWSADAALAEPAHANMRAVFLIRCRFPNGELQPGLLSHHFPRGLTSFVVSVSNLAALPANLQELWPDGMKLSFERTALVAIPECLVQLRPNLLSLAGSPIEAVPPSVFEIPVLECLLLSYTNVQALPRVVAAPSTKWFLLLLQGTNISTFWSWMEPFITLSMWYKRGFFNAYDTPFCRALEARGAGDPSMVASATESTHLASVMDVSTPERLSWAQQAVTCTSGFPFYFPLELEDAIHAEVE